MKAVVSIYKSDAVEFMNEKGLKREEVRVILSPAELDGLKKEYDEVIILSRPMGMPSDVDIVEMLLKKPELKPEPKPKKEEAPIKEAAKNVAEKIAKNAEDAPVEAKEVVDKILKSEEKHPAVSTDAELAVPDKSKGKRSSIQIFEEVGDFDPEKTAADKAPILSDKEILKNVESGDDNIDSVDLTEK